MTPEFHSGYLSDENKNANSKIYAPPMFTAALCTVTKLWKQLKCS